MISEMTRETAIANLKADIKYWEGTTVSTEHLSMAIKSLQQEPCEDCISRQAVLDLINADWKYEGLEESINSLPPVKPQEPKTGHWIKEKTIHGWDGKSYQCSECGRSIHIDPEVEDLSDYPYCHCGLKMTESEDEKE